MANIKFSQFTPQTDYNNVADLVGYDGVVNVRISPDDLISSYLSTHPQNAFVDGIVVGDSGSGTSTNVTLGNLTKTISQINLNHGAGAGAGGFLRATTDLKLGVGSSDILEVNSSSVTFNGEIIIDPISPNPASIKTGTSLQIINSGSSNNQFFVGSDLSFNDNFRDVIITANEGISFWGALFDGTSFTNVGRILTDPQGGGSGGFPATDTIGSWRFTQYGAGNKIDNNTPYALGVDANGILRENLRQPGIQLKISGATGLSNTNNGVDFQIPYNAVIVNDDPTIFNPTVSGAGQGQIEVLQTGRYEFFARYSSFDLFQNTLPTVDGTKFLRITATSNGVKQCVLQDLIVATSVNGEANVTGGGFMDFNAGDIFTITGFHTGATGGNGAQGFPVSSNAFFNEPMVWLVKIQ